jgi:hypothetical protein
MTTHYPAALTALVPVGRMGTMDEVVAAILFLLSPGSMDRGVDINGAGGTTAPASSTRRPCTAPEAAATFKPRLDVFPGPAPAAPRHRDGARTEVYVLRTACSRSSGN